MDTNTHLPDSAEVAKKRRFKSKKSSNKSKKRRTEEQRGATPKKKLDKKTRKLIKRRAEQYNSDDDDSDNEPVNDEPPMESSPESEPENEESEGSGEEEEEGEEDDSDLRPGIERFSEGYRGFRTAFTRIVKKSVPDGSLGPVLSRQKKIIAKKLAEEEAERKVKGETKKEKNSVKEKGHAKPANFLDAHEKYLISQATKGVVRLFNALNKAQHVQKRVDASKSKDAKSLGKQRRAAFLAELHKPSLPTSYNAFTFSSKKGTEGTQAEKSKEPGWAPLRDSYMLTSSKLKDWDKMADSTVAVPDGAPLDSSSDEE